MADLAGRTVTVPDKVERIIIGEGRYVPALAILDRDDPVGRLVGMMGDYEAVDPASYARYRERFPEIAEIARIGRTAKESFSLEWLIAHPPQVYVGTAIGGTASAGSKPWLALGAGVSAEMAQTSLRRSMARPGISQLEAVRAGRAHAVWHHFYNSPFNVAAVQAFAKWLHPTLFAELDPEGLLRRLHERFQPFPLDGVYWTSLQ